MSLRAVCDVHSRYSGDCDNCRMRARNYRRARLMGLRLGTWERGLTGEGLQQMRQHVQSLVQTPGITVAKIAAAVPLAQATIRRLLNGQTAELRVDISAALGALTAEMLLRKPQPATDRVDITGTARRLQALTADGWDTETLGQMSGLGPTDLERWRRAVRPTITRQTHARVAQLYEQIQAMADPCGPSEGARIQGRRFGYLPPYRWEDARIDDPEAQPLPLLADQDDPVWVRRMIETVLARPEPGCAAVLPRGIQRQLAVRAIAAGWTWVQVGAVLGKSHSAAEYLVAGRADRPHTRGGSSVGK